MNTIPKDPIVNFEYTYWLSNDKRYYQLWVVLENNETSFIPQTYANNYTSKVVWNYKWLYRFKANSNNYIINLPSLIFTQSWSQSFENTANNPKFVINNWGNLVQPYDENNKEDVNTVLEKLTQKEDITFTWIVIPTDWNTWSGTLAQELWYTEDEIWYEIFWEKYYTDKNDVENPSSSTPVIVQWKDEEWTHCDNDDYVFTQWWVTYRWAWCNSVLWSWIEWWTSDAYCSNYTWGIAVCWTTQMTSTSKENAWNSTYGTNNIWWKLYTQEEAKSWACPSGWHLPTDVEWTTLENYLNGRICRTWVWIQCPWLWWYRDNTQNATNNVVEALKIPLAGLHNSSPSFSANRWENAFLWSNETIGNEMHTRLFTWSETGIQSQPYPDNYAFSVRCIKN